MANDGVILGFPFIMEDLNEPRWKREAGEEQVDCCPFAC